MLVRQSTLAEIMTKELTIIFDKYFKFLTEEFGYIIVFSVYNEQSFGNFIIELSKGEKKIKIISDRSQIFIYLPDAIETWKLKDDILEEKGILKNRFGMKLELWEGFKIQNQSMELKKYHSLLNI
jgi:hypothetical protein